MLNRREECDKHIYTPTKLLKIQGNCFQSFDSSQYGEESPESIVSIFSL